jgi:PAS domain S-box-containing protein
MRQEEMKRSSRRPKAEPPTSRRKAAVYALGKDVHDHTSVLDAMLDGYYLIDSAGRFLQVNEAFSEMIGYSAAELLTMSIADVEARETPEETLQHIACVMAAGKERFTTLQRHKNGNILSLQISTVLSEDGTQLHSFVRDDTSRTAAERALRSSEAKFAAAFHLAPDILTISQMRDGRFVDVNAAYERASGYSREESIGLTSYDLDLWAVPRHRRDLLVELSRAGSVRDMPMTFRTHDGAIREGKVSAERVEIEGADCLLSIIQDVTEKEQMQRALLFHSRVLDTIGQAIVVSDINGVITYWNQAATALFGLKPEDVIGKTGAELYSPRTADQHAQAIVQETLRQGSSKGELSLTRMDGSPLTVALSLSVLSPGWNHDTSIVGIVTDITEDRRNEAILRESEKWYRELFENSIDPIGVTSTEGIVLDVNPAACAILGIPREQQIGADIRVALSAQWEAFVKSAEDRLGSGEGVFDWTFPSSSGTPETYEIRVRHFSFKGENAVLAVGRNITRRREAEQRLKNTVAEKEVLLQETHHRVKNNLQIIASLLNLRKSGIKDPVALAMIDQSRNRIELMASVYEQVYQSKNLAHIDFAEFLRRSVHDLVESMRQEHMEIDVRFVLDEIKLNLQPAIYLGIVIHELVSNAVKHAFRGRAGGLIQVSLQRGASGELALGVADDGVGVPTDLDTETSTSLGLRLVSALIRQLGGNAAVQRSNGTRWVVTFAVCPV